MGIVVYFDNYFGYEGRRADYKIYVFGLDFVKICFVFRVITNRFD